MQGNRFSFGSAIFGSILLGMLLTTAVWAVQRATPQSQQSQCMDRIHDLGKGVALYIGDWDQQYPSAITYDDRRGEYDWNNWHKFNPSLYDAGWTTQIYPYVQTAQQFACPVATRGVLAGTSGSGPSISYTFNGHLHHYNASGIKEPGRLVVIWEGLGNRAIAGYAVSQPVLKCAGKMPKGTCRYVPGKSPSSFLFKPLGDVGVHQGRINIAYADTHARSIAVGDGDWRSGDPFTYGSQGNPSGYWSDGVHPWTFRPEYDFQDSGSPNEAPFQPMPVAK